MNVGHICTPEVVVASETETVVEVARRMRAQRVGDVVVVSAADERVPVGIATDRDIVVKVVADAPAELLERRVGEIMTRGLVTIREDEDVFRAIHAMRSEGVGRIPVVNAAGHLVGIFSHDDALAYLAGEMSQLAKLAERRQTRVGS
ncbi:MAG: CBS domain-containing protein [Myxococcales bacterium]|nr:CBS domain-containing protein [Myxococcales bacterium]MCB9753356.1 CBS domain-containing protein [Myxococcales bacterium]